MRSLVSFWRRFEWLLLPMIIGLIFFLFQLTQLSQYGATWDEPLHRNWGHLFDFFLQSGDRSVLEQMPGNGVFYGPVYYLLGYRLSEWLMQDFHLPLFEASHVLNLITASIAVGWLFAFVRSLLTKRIAWFSLLFFVLLPPFLAHAHYNPKDIPLLLGVLIASHAFLMAIQRSSTRWFIVSGFLFGAAVALKISALLMAPAVAVTLLVSLVGSGFRVPGSGFIESSLNMIALRRLFITLILATIAFFVGLVLLWPTAWGDLSLIPRSIHFFLTSDYWPGTVLFFGKQYGGAELPWYYTGLEYLMAMPVVTLGLLLVGSLLVTRSVWRNNHRAISVYLLLWIFIPMLFSLKPGLVRYDGMRQFFFTLPAVAVIAGLGLDWFLVRVQGATSHKPQATSLVLILVIFSLVHEIVVVHPFEGAYRNEIVRALIPERMDKVLNLEYWGATYKQGVDWLNENAEPNAIVCVPTADVLIPWYSFRPDLSVGCSVNASYIMFFTRYSKAESPEIIAHQPVFTVERMGAELMRIYRVR